METLAKSVALLVDVVAFMIWFVVSMTVMGTMFFGGTMTFREYYPRDAEEANAVAPLFLGEKDFNASSYTRAELEAMEGGVYASACDALRTRWLGPWINGTEPEKEAGSTVPEDIDMCLWTKSNQALGNYTARVDSTGGGLYAELS